MDDDTSLPRACFVEDPDTGEILTVEKTIEYGRAVAAFHQTECPHEKVAPYRVRVANGSVQVRTCCVECGDRIGTALSQKDKLWVSQLSWQPEEHAATYKSRRDAEWRGILLGLARRQYAERGRLTKGYSQYIRSDDWRTKRQLVLNRCGHVCEGCGVAKATEVHHWTYSHLFNEFLFELLGLCHSCHERLTAERRDVLGRYGEVPIEEAEESDHPF